MVVVWSLVALQRQSGTEVAFEGKEGDPRGYQ